MDVLEAIRTRRSIRRFSHTAGPVSEQDLRCILDAGFVAPSAHNLHPCHFIVVRDKAALNAIALSGKYTKMASQADMCIVVAGDISLQKKYELLIMDCSAAIENMLLAAHGLGLGAVWCGAFREASVDMPVLGELLSLPEHALTLGLVMIGRPDEVREPVDRYDPRFVHHEKW